MDINGKTAVITGGASGLGEATVRKLHSMGAKIAIFDLQEDKGKAIAKELGDRVIFQKVNVVDEASVQAGIAATMSAFGVKPFSACIAIFDSMRMASCFSGCPSFAL